MVGFQCRVVVPSASHTTTARMSKGGNGQTEKSRSHPGEDTASSNQNQSDKVTTLARKERNDGKKRSQHGAIGQNHNGNDDTAMMLGPLPDPVVPSIVYSQQSTTDHGG